MQHESETWSCRSIIESWAFDVLRMEKSKTQEAMAEYKAMARDLAEEFQDKVANPTAEAFIEWLGEILTGGSVGIMPCFGWRYEDYHECHELSP